MKNFKSILLVFEGKTGERSVLEKAVIQAKRHKAKLTVVAVSEMKPSFKEIQALITKDSLTRLGDFIKPVKNKGVRIRAKVLHGPPFLEVIREVLKNNHDLVMITGDGGGGLKRIFLGSTAMHLMRKCPCPVWAMKPQKRMKIYRILAAVDPVSPDQADADVRNALNVKILNLASALARSEGSRLDVLHAWTLYGESIIRSRTRIPEDEIDMLIRKTRDDHSQWMDRLLKQVPGSDLKMHVHLVKGDPGYLIPRFAKQKRIDLIVMGTVGRTGVAGFLIGNTAEKVLHQVDCSVLAVKPDGYISPIKP